MNSPTFQKTKRIIFTGILACLLLAGLYGGIFYYLRELNKDVAELENEVNMLKGGAAANNTAEKSLKLALANKDQFDNFFVGPSAEEEVAFVSSLENIATSSAKVKLDITNLRHEKIVGLSGDKFEHLTLQATAKGTFSAINYFLTLLESFPQGLIIKQMEMQAIGGDPKVAPEWQLTFVLQAFKTK